MELCACQQRMGQGQGRANLMMMDWNEKWWNKRKESVQQRAPSSPPSTPSTGGNRARLPLARTGHFTTELESGTEGHRQEESPNSTTTYTMIETSARVQAMFWHQHREHRSEQKKMLQLDLLGSEGDNYCARISVCVD